MKKNIKSILKRNMPTILTGIGMISLGATIYSTITETIKANEILKNSDEDLEDNYICSYYYCLYD